MQPDGPSRIIGRDNRIDNRGAWLPLQCGPLTLNFDPITAALREIRLDGREVIQAMGPVVRERNWGTVLPRLDDFQHESADDGFKLTFAARCQEKEVDFGWSGEIVGQSEGTLR